MSSASTTPGNLSAKEFELYTVEIAQWIWGMAQGAFNDKQTLSQIVTDAGISMIPFVGDITGIRDLIAVCSRLINDPKKREQAAEWVLLVIFVFALIPVLGGVIKGVGRIALKIGTDTVKDSAAMAKIAEEALKVITKATKGNEQFWLKTLDVMSYQKELIKRFGNFCDMMINTISDYLRFKPFIPPGMVARMEQFLNGLKQLKALSAHMIPEALKELHAKLERLQQFVRMGGVPPANTAKSVAVQTGQKNLTRTDEARIVEDGFAKKIVYTGKYPQNAASSKNTELEKIYQPKEGFPDLKARPTVVDRVEYYPNIASASGPIKNEILQGETLFRAFGEETFTNGIKVNESKPIGVYWGRGAPPRTTEEWRGPYAVLDEWNANGWLCLVHIPHNVKVHACTSTVSEQSGVKFGQFLEGGGQQAFITDFFEERILNSAKQLFDRGGGKESVPFKNGFITIEVKQSGWKNVNGEIGHDQKLEPYAVMTEDLGLNEIRPRGKDNSGKQRTAETSKE